MARFEYTPEDKAIIAKQQELLDRLNAVGVGKVVEAELPGLKFPETVEFNHELVRARPSGEWLIGILPMFGGAENLRMIAAEARISTEPGDKYAFASKYMNLAYRESGILEVTGRIQEFSGQIDEKGGFKPSLTEALRRAKTNPRVNRFSPL